jgi:hypothetical protein
VWKWALTIENDLFPAQSVPSSSISTGREKQGEGESAKDVANGMCKERAQLTGRAEVVHVHVRLV